MNHEFYRRQLHPRHSQHREDDRHGRRLGKGEPAELFRLQISARARLHDDPGQSGTRRRATCSARGSTRGLPTFPEPVDMVDIFRGSQYALPIVQEALALKPRPQVIWMQLGVRNDEAAALAEANGMKVVMNRCPKIEYGRLSSEIAWMGVNTRTISSKKGDDRRHPAHVAQPHHAPRAARPRPPTALSARKADASLLRSPSSVAPTAVLQQQRREDARRLFTIAANFSGFFICFMSNAARALHHPRCRHRSRRGHENPLRTCAHDSCLTLAPHGSPGRRRSQRSAGLHERRHDGLRAIHPGPRARRRLPYRQPQHAFRRPAATAHASASIRRPSAR